MIVSGLRKRSIFDQTGIFSYQLDISFNHMAGQCQFGFSGQNGRQVYFSLTSGALYDFENNLVHGLYGGQEISISGNVNQYQHDYYINNLPVRISGAKETGAAEWFYIDPTGVSADFDLYIKGLRPTFGLTDIIYSGVTGLGTGFITNNTNEKLRIFSGISQDANYRFHFPTGYILGSVPFSGYKNSAGNVLEQETINCNLKTNFGTFLTGIVNRNLFEISQTLIPQVNSIPGSGSSHNFIVWENSVGADPYTSSGLLVDFYLRWSSGVISSGNFTGTWSLLTGLEDTSQQLSVNYFSGITGFSGQFETVGFGARYFKLSYLNSGTGILEFWASGYGGAGFLEYITGGF